MSFIHLASLAQRNASAQQLVQVPANLLETFIPGYGTISRLLLDTFGIDITLLVSVSFFIFALGRSFTYLKNQFLLLVMRFGTCSVEIGAEADTYFWVMDWLSDRGIGQDSHHLIAVSTHRHHRFLPGDDPRDFDMPMPPPPHTSSRKKQKPQRYEPSLGQTQYFWYSGRLFRWHRQSDVQQHRYRRIEGRLYCLSRTTAPIKALIDEASAHYHKKRACNTAIRRPAPRQQRQHGMNLWKTVAMRPSRPLHTIVLGKEQKEQLLSDIEEYLHPDTRQWYAVRGIPYRRGYVSLTFYLCTVILICPSLTKAALLRSCGNWKDIFVVWHSRIFRP
jgi:chaperone BCS1